MSFGRDLAHGLAYPLFDRSDLSCGQRLFHSSLEEVA
jgi:hypothetical protein